LNKHKSIRENKKIGDDEIMRKRNPVTNHFDSSKVPMKCNICYQWFPLWMTSDTNWKAFLSNLWDKYPKIVHLLEHGQGRDDYTICKMCYEKLGGVAVYMSPEEYHDIFFIGPEENRESALKRITFMFSLDEELTHNQHNIRFQEFKKYLDGFEFEDVAGFFKERKKLSGRL
jgi:hypothetical protein